jgi:hypothetical protein
MKRHRKLYPLFTFLGASSGHAGSRLRLKGRGPHMVIVGLAIGMFIALFGWGAGFFGWSDADGKVQLALATSFILGIIGGYKSKGD